MTLVDRFICRRDGHKPAATITRTSGVTINEYITRCIRCGQLITWKTHHEQEEQHEDSA